MPGYIDRALTPAQRLRMYATWSIALSGLGAGIIMIYRTFIRPNSVFGGWGGSWMPTILGRREL